MAGNGHNPMTFPSDSKGNVIGINDFYLRLNAIASRVVRSQDVSLPVFPVEICFSLGIIDKPLVHWVPINRSLQK